jgi:hypothetical protein
VAFNPFCAKIASARVNSSSGLRLPIKVGFSAAVGSPVAVSAALPGWLPVLVGPYTETQPLNANASKKVKYLITHL